MKNEMKWNEKDNFSLEKHFLIFIDFMLNYYLQSVNMSHFWLDKVKKNELISKNGEWILANVNCTGYYRVNYDPENWERLLTQLETDRNVSNMCRFGLFVTSSENKSLFPGFVTRKS